MVSAACSADVRSRQRPPDRHAGPAAPALVSMHDWAFLLGPGTIPAVNALLLAPLLLRAGLVPRALPLMGLVGAPLLLAASVGTLFGIIDQVSPVGFLSALLIAAWEIGLGFWLVIKGFNPDAVERLEMRELVEVG